MDTKAIRELADTMRATGLTLIEITERDFSLKLERPQFAKDNNHCESSSYNYGMAESSLDNTSATDNVFKELKSQMVGTYYNSPSPDEEPFVKIGSKIKKGDILCIIEAMKLMNEFTAPEDGEVIEICAQNGQLVEFGQCLFKIR